MCLIPHVSGVAYKAKPDPASRIPHPASRIQHPASQQSPPTPKYHEPELHYIRFGPDFEALLVRIVHEYHSDLLCVLHVSGAYVLSVSTEVGVGDGLLVENF